MALALAFVSRNAPAPLNATMMGLAYLTLFIASFAIGWLGTLYEPLGPTAFRIVALGLIVLAVVRRNLSTAVFLFISVELMGLVTEAGKRLSDRPRPSSALVDAVSTSFPSGHALGVMVGVLALLTVLWPVMPVRLRVPVAVVGAGLVFLVGFARVILNVHHPSDVVAGWALGYLYYLLCVRLVPPRPLTSAVETPAELDTVP